MSDLPPVNPELYVYMWGDGCWVFEDDLEEYLDFGGVSDDFCKVCFGEPDYPEELYE